MFDDRLFDIIMEEMVSEFGPDVRTDEGSLAYNACCKIAAKLEDVYQDMDLLSENMLPDTMDLDHLIRYGTERGIEYAYATAPIVKGVFLQTIDMGTQFTCSDYTYTVTGVIDAVTYQYQLTCDTPGVDANATTGALTPVDYIDDYLGGSIIEVLVEGTADEDEEEYRNKILSSFKATAFGGNKADYRNFINAITGVGGCKPLRRAAGSDHIDIYVISSGYVVPSSALIDDIQTAVDPTVNAGEGDGMAPICHTVVISPVGSVTCDISTTLTLDTGYTVEGVQLAVEAAIESYLEDLRAEWQDNELNAMTVRIAQIEAKVLTVEGVLDIADTEINGDADNLVITYDKIPLLGEVVLNV